VVVLISEMSHLPIIGDPIHTTGKRSLVAAMNKAMLAVGANCLMVEVHPDLGNALCDGAKGLTGDGFAELLNDLN